MYAIVDVTGEHHYYRVQLRSINPDKTTHKGPEGTGSVASVDELQYSSYCEKLDIGEGMVSDFSALGIGSTLKSSISPFTTRHLEITDLPLEILGDIFEEFSPHGHQYGWTMCPVCQWGQSVKLDQSDICNLRLVCQLFYELASPLLLPTLDLDISQASIDILEQLLAYPRVAAGVRSIKLRMDYRPKAIADDLVLFIDTRLEVLSGQVDRSDWTLEAAQYAGVDPDVPRQVSKAIDNFNELYDSWQQTKRNWDSPNPDISRPAEKDDYGSLLLGSFERFRDLHLEQSSMIADGTFAQKLASAITRLGNVENLVFYNEPPDNMIGRYWSKGDPYDFVPVLLLDNQVLASWLETGMDWQTVESVCPGDGHNFAARLLTDLPIAIHKAGYHLRSLVVTTFPCSQDYHMMIPPTQSRVTLLEELRAACQTLESVVIDHASNYLPIQQARIAGDDKRCIDDFISAVVSSPRLRFLEIDLRCLGLNLGNGTSLAFDGCHQLGSVVARFPTFPHLESLWLSNVELRQEELERLFQGMGYKLKRLGLYTKLQSGSWIPPLQLLHDRLAPRMPNTNGDHLRSLQQRKKKMNYELNIDEDLEEYLSGTRHDNPLLLPLPAWQDSPSEASLSVTSSSTISDDDI
ncbi:hypothetical protein B0T21DRAFT_393365 [Apiosordaria backusii]|uniref:F-box domain-containing protein n=1 Tax=Apiosordaria backusii TaxID=314023 RepID=A0AA40EGF6_9PEZI|nr:hypothetical protein B0T21DRAFT_393365 [Apiosordaria backusii]